MPGRVLGVIGYAAASGQTEIDQVVSAPQELQIPFLMRSNCQFLKAIR
jgi:hypothetical protein